MISASFNAYHEEMREAKRAALAEEVPRICRELAAEGLYPNRERGSVRLSKRARRGMVEALGLQTINELELK